MCSSVTSLFACPNKFARLASGAYVQCEVVDGQCLTTGGENQKLCTLPACDENLAIDDFNLAEGVAAKVSSECYKNNPTNKGYLTDGDTRRTGSGDKKYWHSCSENNPNAEVEFPKKCIRQVKIWTRADCCSGQMKDVVAEIWSDGAWKQCGGISSDVGTKNSFSFNCAIVGTKARIIKYGGRKWITTSEMQVFPGLYPRAPSRCDSSLAVNNKNLAKGLIAKVSSECYKRNPTNKGYLTDGDNRKSGSGDKQYWHSCKEKNPNAEVEFAETCVREVKIWTRADCCSHQMKGVVAEIWSNGKWEQCGGKSNNVGTKNSFSFNCAIAGTKARIVKYGNSKWITTSEMEVFSGVDPTAPPKCEVSMPVAHMNVAKGVAAKVSSECYKRNPTNKGYLTDGDNRKSGSGDKQYWHSCKEKNPNAEVEFAETCVREVKIWSRADCCSHQMKGVVAEIWSNGKWEQCGGKSNNVGTKNSFSFNCAIAGSKARIIKYGNSEWITTSEMEVMPAWDPPKCDSSMSVGSTNLAKGLIAKVSSECYKRNPTNKGYLTDGDNRKKGRGDKKYWHSCKEKNPNAEVEFAETCVREVKIWSRADCCSHQMKGVVAEIWSNGKWERCGGKSKNVGKKKSFSFKCAISGTKARIIKYGNRKWITTSEMEVYGAS